MFNKYTSSMLDSPVLRYCSTFEMCLECSSSLVLLMKIITDTITLRNNSNNYFVEPIKLNVVRVKRVVTDFNSVRCSFCVSTTESYHVDTLLNRFF